MKSVFVEVTNGPQNWGKFMVARFDSKEYEYTSQVFREDILPEMERVAKRHKTEAPRVPALLHGIGWGRSDIIVFDLQTCEGASFLPGGNAHADLDKHKIWVCPMFEPFLEWLYKQDLTDLEKLPKRVDLPDAPFAMSGYRREGKKK